MLKQENQSLQNALKDTFEVVKQVRERVKVLEEQQAKDRHNREHLTQEADRSSHREGQPPERTARLSTPMPPNMPPEGQQPLYHYSQSPYSYYPPPMGRFAPPLPSPKRGLQWWHWLLIAGGGIIAVTCILCGSLYTLGGIVARNALTPSYSNTPPVAFPSATAFGPTRATPSATAFGPTRATGTLSFSGSAGDFIAGGESYSYSTSKGDVLTISASSTGSTVSIGVTGYNGDLWTLDLGAPGTVAPINGKPAVLVPGTYSDAHRYPFNGNGPGLALYGNGRGCNTVTGSFTIIDAVLGAQNYVQKFDATFVQHCEGGTSAASGQVHISNPPAG